jgi:hypothetical protein
VQERTISRVMVASRHKVNFLPDGSTSSRNYGWFLAFPKKFEPKSN